MSAYDLWQELRAGGWARLSEWRTTAKSEGLHLDFKAANFVVDDASEDDKKNLAKELSGFANVDGGVLVFGGVTTKDAAGQDILHQLPGVTPLDVYAERLRLRVKSSTTPPIAGVDVITIEDPSHPNSGVVAIYVPFSDGGPYRAEGPATVGGRYFMRQTSDTVVMPHQILAGMFGRRPLPRLRVGLERDKDGRTAIVHVENLGKGAAEAAFVRFKFDGGAGGQTFARGSWREKRADVHNTGWRIAFGLPPGDLIYPGERRNPGVFDLPGDRDVTVRVDCANAPPLEVQQLATLAPDQILWFDPPE